MNQPVIHDELRKTHSVVGILYPEGNFYDARTGRIDTVTSSRLERTVIIPAYLAFKGCDITSACTNIHLVYAAANGEPVIEVPLMCRRGENKEEIDLNNPEWKTLLLGEGERKFYGTITNLRRLFGWLNTWKLDLENERGKETLYKAIGTKRQKRELLEGLLLGDYVHGRARREYVKWTDNLSSCLTGGCYSLPGWKKIFDFSGFWFDEITQIKKV